MDTKLCECGCGKPAPKAKYPSWSPRFIAGHRVVSAATKAKMSAAISAAMSGHGLSGTPMYKSWTMMNERCRSPKATGYAQYGGKGIKVCERWQGANGFANFLADMGERPPGTSIGRFGDEGNYEPGNCNWMTPKEQAANKRPRKKAA